MLLCASRRHRNRIRKKLKNSFRSIIFPGALHVKTLDFAHMIFVSPLFPSFWFELRKTREWLGNNPRTSEGFLSKRGYVTHDRLCHLRRAGGETPHCHVVHAGPRAPGALSGQLRHPPQRQAGGGSARSSFEMVVVSGLYFCSGTREG